MHRLSLRDQPQGRILALIGVNCLRRIRRFHGNFLKKNKCILFVVDQGRHGFSRIKKLTLKYYFLLLKGYLSEIDTIFMMEKTYFFGYNIKLHFFNFACLIILIT